MLRGVHGTIYGGRRTAPDRAAIGPAPRDPWSGRVARAGPPARVSRRTARLLHTLASRLRVLLLLDSRRWAWLCFIIVAVCFANKEQMKQPRILTSRLPETGRPKFFALCLCVSVVSLWPLAGCEVERRQTDAELGLNPQQIAGRRIYDNYCDRCHAPYSSRGRQGPSMKGVFRRPYLPMSGMPANDDRVSDIVRLGRNKMPGYAQVLNQQQINDLLAYLHTL